jgi:hypothetical protein
MYWRILRITLDIGEDIGEVWYWIYIYIIRDLGVIGECEVGHCMILEDVERYYWKRLRYDIGRG